MQAVEEAESSLSDRVEVMGVKEQDDKSTKEDTQKKSEEIIKTEDEKGMKTTCILFFFFTNLYKIAFAVKCPVWTHVFSWTQKHWAVWSLG